MRLLSAKLTPVTSLFVALVNCVACVCLSVCSGSNYRIYNTYFVTNTMPAPVGFAVGQCGRVLSSKDGGKTWAVALDGIQGMCPSWPAPWPDLGLRGVWFDNLTYVGFAVGDARPGDSSGIILRSSWGASWQETHSPAKGNLRRVVFEPTARTGFAVGQSDVLSTIDGGDHWTRHEEVTEGGWEVTTVQTNTGRSVFWLAGYHSFNLRWTDDVGATWHSVSLGTSVTQVYCLRFLASQRAIVSGYRFSNPPQPYVAISMDGGQTWRTASTPQPTRVQFDYIVTSVAMQAPDFNMGVAVTRQRGILLTTSDGKQPLHVVSLPATPISSGCFHCFKLHILPALVKLIC